MKPAEIREMTVEELKAKDSELAKEHFNLKMRHATRQLENPLKLRFVKRDIARIKTVMAEKGLHPRQGSAPTASSKGAKKHGK